MKSSRRKPSRVPLQIIDLTDCVEIRKVPQFGPGCTEAQGHPSMFRVLLRPALLRAIWPQLEAARARR